MKVTIVILNNFKNSSNNDDKKNKYNNNDSHIIHIQIHDIVGWFVDFVTINIFIIGLCIFSADAAYTTARTYYRK